MEQDGSSLPTYTTHMPCRHPPIGPTVRSYGCFSSFLPRDDTRRKWDANRHQKRTIRTQLTSSLSLLLLLQFPLTISLHLLRSLASLCFKCKLCHQIKYVLVHHLFHVFLGLSFCLAPSTSKVIHFSPHHHHPFSNMSILYNLFLCTIFKMSPIPNHILNSE